MQYTALDKQNLSGNHRAVAPPDPIPNSEVKHSIADGSVGSPHARVGHFQAPNKKKGHSTRVAFLFCALNLSN